MGGMGSCGCGEHWRTLENDQDEILHNSISPIGPNPEVHAENFPYIRQRKNHSQTSTKYFPICHPHLPIHYYRMPSTNQPLSAKMCKQAEEMKRVWEAWEREEQEKEEALLQAAEEEERWEVEKT